MACVPVGILIQSVIDFCLMRSILKANAHSKYSVGAADDGYDSGELLLCTFAAILDELLACESWCAVNRAKKHEQTRLLYTSCVCEDTINTAHL